MNRSGPHREIWQRDRKAAIRYQRYAVPFLLGPWVPDVVEALAPRPGERVLDVACGTGAVSRLAAKYVGSTGQVTGLDLNPEMLAVAKTVPQDGGTPIRWRQGDAVALRFSNGAFDLAFCQQGLQFFPDRLAALREIRRVLVPGGRLAVAVWRRIGCCPYFLALAQALEHHAGTEAATQMRSSFALGDPGELRSLITEAGFRSVEVRQVSKSLHLPPLEDFVPRHLEGTSLAGAIAAMDSTARSGLIAGVSAALEAYARKDGATLPFEIHLAVGYSEAVRETDA